MESDVKNISLTLGNLANSSEKINISIVEVLTISEGSAARIEETTASVEESSNSMVDVASTAKKLNSLANDLKQMITAFRL
ncbi:hypothetical protein [Metabacillus halosaccharovorans]|uniref:hypothetical protein n=1 Tax=Metabacillus halosaccharovorans TaxID=930124 RepID=UPI000995B828|nr:hypothetical protein [Metabacillus halosaccharovorans]